MRTPVLAATMLLTLSSLACFWRRGSSDEEPEPAQASLATAAEPEGCVGAMAIQRRLDDSTRAAQISFPGGGYVLARYYIDAAGRPEMRTFEVIRTTDSKRIKEFRKLAAQKRYRPFEPMPGCPVRGLVVDTFTFKAKELPVR